MEGWIAPIALKNSAPRRNDRHGENPILGKYRMRNEIRANFTL
jgi:hypothetical protein